MWKLTLTAGLCLIFTCLDISCNGNPVPATTPPSDFCDGKGDGDYAASENADHYYSCVNQRVYFRPCPQGLIFDETLLVCNYPTAAPSDKTTTSPSTATTTTAMPNPTVPEGFCDGKADGHYAAPNLPNSFYSCVAQNGYVQPCPHNLVFKQKLQKCDWPNQCSSGPGLYPDPSDPQSYFNCDAAGTPHHQQCGGSLVFKTSCSCCGFP